MSSRKSVQKKVIIEEESDVESDVESDIGSDIISQIDEHEENDDIDNTVKDIEDDEDDEEDEGIINLKKHSHNIQKEESKVILVAPEKRITSEYMTLPEYTMVIGTRATHIAEGSPIYVDPTGITSAREIAIKEVDQKRCPLSISRKIHNRQVEIWMVNEMTMPLL